LPWDRHLAAREAAGAGRGGGDPSAVIQEEITAQLAPLGDGLGLDAVQEGAREGGGVAGGWGIRRCSPETGAAFAPALVCSGSSVLPRNPPDSGPGAAASDETGGGAAGGAATSQDASSKAMARRKGRNSMAVPVNDAATTLAERPVQGKARSCAPLVDSAP